MILFVHLLFGAAIGSLVKNIPLAVILALLSHYFLDFLPHIEYGIANIKEKQWRKKLFVILKVGLDFCLGILLIFIFSENQPILYIYALVSILPDAFTIINNLAPNAITKAHDKIHPGRIHFLRDKKISIFWRTINPAIIVVVSILLLRI